MNNYYLTESIRFIHRENIKDIPKNVEIISVSAQLDVVENQLIELDKKRADLLLQLNKIINTIE